MTVLTVLALTLCALSAGLVWWMITRFQHVGSLRLTTRTIVLATTLPAGLLALAALLGLNAPDATGGLLTAAVAIGAVAAVTGGGVAAVVVLRLADPRLDEPYASRPPGRTEVLRGGAWIGALERLAVLSTLLGGWYEGVAVVLAVKGLGRYPELRRPAAAERFIIGTLTSMLWVLAVVGVLATIR